MIKRYINIDLNRSIVFTTIFISFRVICKLLIDNFKLFTLRNRRLFKFLNRGFWSTELPFIYSLFCLNIFAIYFIIWVDLTILTGIHLDRNHDKHVLVLEIKGIKFLSLIIHWLNDSIYFIQVLMLLENHLFWTFFFVLVDLQIIVLLLLVKNFLKFLLIEVVHDL